MLRLFSTGLKVDVCQGIEFIHHNIYIVATDACAECRYAFPLVLAGYGVKLPVAYLAFLRVEMRGYQRHTAGVSDEDNLICQVLRFHVKMKYGAIIVYDKL